MERYVCIHGHFYQPPRENAWLESIEWQDSAYPYHDWNERITAECYAPNATSRILDDEDWIVKIVNNYAKISFNFGPTLLAWMEENSPDVYQAVLDADQSSQPNFSGHGSALAQAYNHIIMPLANHADRYTQVLWGIRDFEHRFGRQPEGMWLPETAVDLETLDILAELGISFTILAPHQAGKVRQIGSDAWSDVSGGHIDPTMAYELQLPSGRKLSIFFYDDIIARGVAFEGLLSNGRNLAQRLTGAFAESPSHPQIVHIATDGESYGHHHRFGDMALAFALNYIEENNLATITNYGEYLEKNPPTHQVEIIENTSWSCPHGIERWHSDCGCNSGGHPRWKQAWREPLRNALDWLRGDMAPRYEEMARQFLNDPWAARNEYIEVILDRSPDNIQQFLKRYATRELNDAERVTVLKLLELQRHALLMYTSCGWFFDDLSGIETVQIIQYAGRVVQLAQELFGDDTEDHFLQLMETARSNVAQQGDGRKIYEKFVKPAMVDLAKVTAHFVVSSLFEEYNEEAKIYCYPIVLEDYQSFASGKATLALGRAKVSSEITHESDLLAFGVLHFGDHNINAGVRGYQGEEPYGEVVREITQSFSVAEFPDVIRLMDKHFGTSSYSLKSLFRDEQRKVLGRILESTLSEIEASYRQLYEHHFPLMRFLADLGTPLPKSLRSAAEFILDIDLHIALSNDNFEVERIKGFLDGAAVWDIHVDAEGMQYELQHTLEKIMMSFMSTPEELPLLNNLTDAVALTQSSAFDVDLGKVQNLYYEMLQSARAEFENKARQGDKTAAEWLAQFLALGQQLSIRVS